MKPSKRQIALVLTDDLYVRNYATSGAFDELSKNFDIDIIVDSKVTLRAELANLGPVIGDYEISENQVRLHNLHFQLLMWRFRKKSRTFFYRWLRNTNWSLILRQGPPLARAISFLRWIAAAIRNPNGFRIPLLANSALFPAVSKVIRSQIKADVRLQRLLEAKSYAAVLFPSSAFEPGMVDLVNIGKELQLPTLCLIDNWDNLTSKTVFWSKPDYLGVWGKQTVEQAIDVHGFLPEQVHPLGNPRFEGYFTSYSNNKDQPQYTFPYILFVGSAMPFDEIGALKSIDDWLQITDDVADDVMVVYRPHPWQQKRSVRTDFVKKEFSRVVLDNQIAEAIGQGIQLDSRSSAFQPSLSYYPNLLQSASCVVGPLTTLLLEATLCLRPTVGLSYFDGYHANTSKRYFTHFEGMERVPGFRFCEDHTELTWDISRALQSGTIPGKTSRKATSYFVTSSPGTYSHRLLQLVLRISQKQAIDPLMAHKL